MSASIPASASTSKKRKRWFADSGTLWIAGVLCAVAIAGLALTDLQIPGLPVESSTPAKIAYNSSSTQKSLSVSVHPPQDHLLAGQVVPLELLLTNSTSRPIAMHVSWAAPCFRITPSQPEEFVVAGTTPYLLELSVTPVCQNASEPLTIYISTKDADPAFLEIVSIAPIQISAFWEHDLYRFFFLLSALLRALAIPAVLAWLAFWFQRRSADRDERLKEEQEARARRESVLTTRIPEYSKIVQEHYLPISRRGDTIESEMPPVLKAAGIVEDDELKARVAAAFSGLKSDAPNELWRLLCAILLYRARLLQLFSSKGGIYFRSNQAERLYAELVNAFFAAMYKHLLKEDFSEAVAVFDPEESLSSALHRCLTGRANDSPSNADPAGSSAAERALARSAAKENVERFARVFERFKIWVLDDPADFRAYTRLIQVSSRILDFECDRPFYQTGPYTPTNPVEPEQSGWYFDPPLLDFEREMYEFPVALRAELDPEITYYIEHIPPKCKWGFKAYPLRPIGSQLP